MHPKGSRKRAADAEATTSKAKSSKKDDLTNAGAASKEAQEESNAQNTESTLQASDDATIADPEDHDMDEAKVQSDPYTYIRHCAPRFECEARYNREHGMDEDWDEEKGSESFKDDKTEELWTIVESMIWWMVEEPHAPDIKALKEGKVLQMIVSSHSGMAKEMI
ncbi:hypothetical protein M436DRAFT_62660 [Aureobasidium namibiae CBS 147.97]|uniref:Uncharacterized protein n=1 Tax=Aureobasidium namibiae CBS 147.97 TaxID=1043004 RepID=A0A074WWX2_9PEZI